MVIFTTGRKCAQHEATAHTARSPVIPASRRRMVAHIALAGVLALGLTTNHALAKGNFTVVNQSDKKISIVVYDGGDGVCDTKAKNVYVESSKTENIQCHGGGKARCKIMVEKDGDPICHGFNRKACDDKFIRIIHDNETLTVTNNDNTYACEVSGG